MSAESGKYLGGWSRGNIPRKSLLALRNSLLIARKSLN